ncbi:hypothetical protein [Pseudomonas sp. 2FE]|uniref:hypothetical protein n=1 Tax=Pseudomonas sp. 2FE TaxID=2502190 RepID=UPI0010F96790|nr:hypothetical protein [Pseudomonas sp. 2FE]
MAIEDSDPERRNLTVMSAAFIIYYLAGGSFKNNEITLEVVNINFSRPTVLAVIAWLMLFWFIYRYWQTHQDHFRNAFPAEFVKQQSSATLKRHLDSTLPKQADDPQQSYFPSGVWWNGNRVKVGYINATSISRSASGHRALISHEGNVRSGELHLSGIKGWSVALLLTCKTFIAEPSFAGYIVPYLLAAFAITLGVANYVTQVL